MRVRLICGTDDPFLVEAREAVAVLKTAGTPVEWIETPGGHDWSTWRDHLRHVLSWLFR